MERRLPHRYRSRPAELDCFEYKNFLHAAEQLQLLRTKSDMLDAIPDGHYVQFLNDISYRLMQRVCSLESLFVSTEPVHMYQQIGVVILNYLKDLCSDWFGSADQLKQAFQKWNLVLVLQPDAALAAASTSAPLTPTQQEHRQKVALTTPAKQESKAMHQKLARSVEQGRKQIRELQLQRQAWDVAE